MTPENKEQGTRNSNKERRARKGDDIAERLLELALEVLPLLNELAKTPMGRHVGQQAGASATSAGANYEEARCAESVDDFVHKIRVGTKELRETQYWLKLIERAGWLKSSIGPLIQESDELIAILIASARTARRAS